MDFDDVMTFIGRFVVNGIIAIFFALIPTIIIMIVLWLLMIPFSIIFGASVPDIISSWIEQYTFKIIYLIMFIELMLEDYNKPNIKFFINKWFFRRKNKNSDNTSNNDNNFSNN